MGKMVITDAGIAEVVNAENTGTAPVTLTHIGFGSGKYTATAERTALQAEFKRFDAISGGGVGDNVFHVTMEDDSADAYTVYEVGVFTESGTLFAVYSQTTPIIQKSAGSIGMLAVDILLDEMNPASVTVGDTNFVLNPATTEREGVIELATEAEAKAGTDARRAITAATLQAVIQNHSNIVHRSSAETITGKKTFDANITVNGSIYSASADECLNICGGETVADGAYLRLDSKGSSTPGVFRVVANDGTTTKTLLGKPDGTLMWDGKYVTLQGDCLPVTGGTMTGRINANGIAIGNTVDNGYVSIMGGSDFASGGGAISVYGSNHSLYHGDIILRAKSETGESWLRLRSDGTFTLNGKYITLQGDCLPITGGTMTGNIYSASTNENINICGGETVADGAYLRLDSKDSSTPGVFRVVANDGTTTKTLLGKPDGTLTWDGADIVTAAGTGLAKSTNTLSLATVVTAGNAGPTANKSPGYGGTFTVPYFTFDAYGRVTGRTNRTITMPADCVSAKSTGTNWYIKFASGLIIQGIFVAAGDAEVTVTLPTAMTTTTYCAQNTGIGDTAYSESASYIKKRTKTTVTIKRIYHTGGSLILVIGF